MFWSKAAFELPVKCSKSTDIVFIVTQYEILIESTIVSAAPNFLNDYDFYIFSISQFQQFQN